VVPPPGVAVAIIALIAAVMSIQNEMQPWHKTAWIIVIGAFMSVELVAIVHER
jgi:hypothetical protein